MLPFPEIQFPQEDARIAFYNKYAELRTAFIKHEKIPTEMDEILLRESYAVAFPTAEEYLEYAFANVRETAKKHNVPCPPLPKPELLDLSSEPLSGIGPSLFVRLIYIDKLASKAVRDINESNEIISEKNAPPTLDLLDTNYVFNTLKAESSLQIPPTTKQPAKRGFLSALFGAEDNPKTQDLLVGIVLQLTSTSRVAGENLFVATIDCDGKGHLNLALSKEQFNALKTVDCIGLAGLEPPTRKEPYSKVEHVSVLVPAAISKLLKEIDNKFAPFSNSNDTSNTAIFGRVMSFDNDTLMLTIKDQTGSVKQVKTTSPIGIFGLQPNSVFIAKPTKLRADGLYVIEPQTTLEIKAPFAGRLVSGLMKNNFGGSPQNRGQDLAEKQPLFN